MIRVADRIVARDTTMCVLIRMPATAIVGSMIVIHRLTACRSLPVWLAVSVSWLLVLVAEPGSGQES